MSYAMSAALQRAVYERLSTDAPVQALIGAAVYDAVPAGEVPDLYLSLGPEEVKDQSDQVGSGAEHRFALSVITSQPGFYNAKLVAAAVCDALHLAELALTRGRLVGLWFERASARREGPAGRTRRIDLRFRARVEDA